MPRIRITGIVREANALRQALSAPPSIERLDELARGVRESLRQIQSILHRHRMDARSLPPASRRAHDFLQKFDPSQVSTAASVTAPHATGYRTPESIGFRGLRGFFEHMLDNLARSAHGNRLDPYATLQLIRQTALRLNDRSERERFAAADLKPESRRILGWLRYFSDASAFQAYLDALRRARLVFEHLPFGSRNWKLPLLLQFRPSSHLYRCRPAADGTRVMLISPMIAFPPEVFRLLGQQMLGSVAHRCDITQAMMADDYQAIALELENAAGVVEHTRGLAYDLNHSFTRVNREYFDNLIGRPRLAWTRRLTGRVFGHYDFVNDQLCISSTLDRREVPEFVVDHVMHHELLHKKHGFRWQGNRRHAHTPEFRQEERQFRRYEEADRFLNALSAALS